MLKIIIFIFLIAPIVLGNAFIEADKEFKCNSCCDCCKFVEDYKKIFKEVEIMKKNFKPSIEWDIFREECEYILREVEIKNDPENK